MLPSSPCAHPQALQASHVADCRPGVRSVVLPALRPVGARADAGARLRRAGRCQRHHRWLHRAAGAQSVVGRGDERAQADAPAVEPGGDLPVQDLLRRRPELAPLLPIQWLPGKEHLAFGAPNVAAAARTATRRATPTFSFHTQAEYCDFDPSCPFAFDVVAFKFISVPASLPRSQAPAQYLRSSVTLDMPTQSATAVATTA